MTKYSKNPHANYPKYPYPDYYHHYRHYYRQYSNNPYYYNYQNSFYRPHLINQQPNPYAHDPSLQQYHVQDQQHKELSLESQRSLYLTRDMMRANLAPTGSGMPELKYKLEVVQQPVRARMCGFGDKVN